MTTSRFRCNCDSDPETRDWQVFVTPYITESGGHYAHRHGKCRRCCARIGAPFAPHSIFTEHELMNEIDTTAERTGGQPCLF